MHTAPTYAVGFGWQVDAGVNYKKPAEVKTEQTTWVTVAFVSTESQTQLMFSNSDTLKYKIKNKKSSF